MQLADDDDDVQPFSDYFGGWLVKLPGNINDADKGISVAQKLGRAVFSLTPAALQSLSYRKRFFVLDGNELRYYRDETCRNQCVDGPRTLRVCVESMACLPSNAASAQSILVPFWMFSGRCGTTCSRTRSIWCAAKCLCACDACVVNQKCAATADYRRPDLHPRATRWQPCHCERVVRSYRIQDRDKPQTRNACTISAQFRDQKDGVPLCSLELAASAPH